MSETCDRRFWLLQSFGHWPIVALTTDDPTEAHAARGYQGWEIIDRHADPLPPYKPEIVA